LPVYAVVLDMSKLWLYQVIVWKVRQISYIWLNVFYLAQWHLSWEFN